MHKDENIYKLHYVTLSQTRSGIIWNKPEVLKYEAMRFTFRMYPNNRVPFNNLE